MVDAEKEVLFNCVVLVCAWSLLVLSLVVFRCLVCLGGVVFVFVCVWCLFGLCVLCLRLVYFFGGCSILRFLSVLGLCLFCFVCVLLFIWDGCFSCCVVFVCVWRLSCVSYLCLCLVWCLGCLFVIVCV